MGDDLMLRIIFVNLSGFGSSEVEIPISSLLVSEFLLLSDDPTRIFTGGR